MREQSHRDWAIVILIFGLLIYFNWGNFYDAYGKRFNGERTKIGILEIPSNWITKNRGTKTKLWRPKNMKEVKIGRFGKEVLIDNGKIYMERDRIVNKELGKDEAIEVTYQFEEEPRFIYKYFEFRKKEEKLYA